MTKCLFVAVTLFSLATGIAFAQNMPLDTAGSTTSQISSPGTGTFTTSKWQKKIDSDGTETDKSQSYSSGSNGSKSTSSTVVTTPDGSRQRMSQDDRVVAPSGAVTTTTTTTEKVRP